MVRRFCALVSDGANGWNDVADCVGDFRGYVLSDADAKDGVAFIESVKGKVDDGYYFYRLYRDHLAMGDASRAGEYLAAAARAGHADALYEVAVKNGDQDMMRRAAELGSAEASITLASGGLATREPEEAGVILRNLALRGDSAALSPISLNLSNWVPPEELRFWGLVLYLTYPQCGDEINPDRACPELPKSEGDWKTVCDIAVRHPMVFNSTMPRSDMDAPRKELVVELLKRCAFGVNGAQSMR